MTYYQLNISKIKKKWFLKPENADAYKHYRNHNREYNASDKHQT